MTSKSYRRPRFKLPADTQPVGTQQVCLTIPDGDDYVMHLLAALHELTWTRNYQYHATLPLAGETSRTWQTVLNDHPIVVGTCNMDVRQSTCYVLEKSADGETWVQFADLSCIIQLPPPIYTTPLPDGRSASDAMVDDILRYLWGVLDEINSELIAGTPNDDIVRILHSRVTSETNAIARSAIEDMVTAAAAESEATRNDALDPAAWAQPREDILCSDAMAAADPTDVLGWLKAFIENMSAALNQLPAWIAEPLNALADLLGVGLGDGLLKGGWASGGGGADFGYGPVDCSEFVTWINFDDADTGYSITVGTVTAGEGWAGSNGLLHARREVPGQPGVYALWCGILIDAPSPLAQVQLRVKAVNITPYNATLRVSDYQGGPLPGWGYPDWGRHLSGLARGGDWYTVTFPYAPAETLTQGKVLINWYFGIGPETAFPTGKLVIDEISLLPA